MQNPRIRLIPLLLLNDRKIVKGTKFKKHKYIGDPINTFKIFNDKLVDEISIFNIEKNFNYNSDNLDYLERIFSEAFIPVSYGGNIKSLDTIRKIIKIGAEKIILNSAVHNDIQFLKNAIREFGESTINVCLDYKEDFFGRKHIYINHGTKKVSKNIEAHIKELNNLNVGELIIQSINREGTSLGFDYSYFNHLTQNLRIQSVISGGSIIGDYNFQEYYLKYGIENFSIGSAFIFRNKMKSVLINYPSRIYEGKYDM